MGTHSFTNSDKTAVGAHGIDMGRLVKERWPFFVLALASLVVLACTFASSRYARGTDQFWYVADVESILRGQYVTNNIFPANMVSPASLPGPFVHNNITLYAVVPLAAVLGGNRGWLAANLLCTFGSAFLVFLSLRGVSVRVAGLVASLFLLLPSTVWLTCNALSEPIYTLLASACLFVWIRVREPVAQSVFVVTAILATLAKDNLALLLLVPIFGLCLKWEDSRGKIGKAVYVVGVSAIGLAASAVLRSTVFTENIHYSLAARLVSAIPPKNDNMAPYFLSIAPAFDWAVFAGKIVRNIAGLVRFSAAESLFIAPFYALLVFFLWSLAKKWRRLQVDGSAARASLVTAVLLVSYFATVLFFQNETRYTQFVVPSLLISTSLLMSWTQRRVQVLAGFLVFLIPVALMLTLHIRKEGAQEFREATRIEQCVDSQLAAGIPLLVVRDAGEIFRFIEVTFAVRPRPALIIEESDFCGQLPAYRARFNVRYAFGPGSFLAPRSIRVANIQSDAGRFADYGIYDVQNVCH